MRAASLNDRVNSDEVVAESVGVVNQTMEPSTIGVSLRNRSDGHHARTEGRRLSALAPLIGGPGPPALVARIWLAIQRLIAGLNNRSYS